MRPPRPLPALLALGAMPLATAHAQELVYGASEGEMLLGFDASYRYTHSDAVSGAADETESFTGRANLGWFLRREHELGFEIAPSFIRNELGGDSLDLYLGGYYNYNWWTSPHTTLYAGPQLGVLRTDPSGGDSETAFSWGLHVGARYWIDPRVSFDVEPRVSFTALDDALGGDTAVFDVLFGLSVRL